MSDVNWDSAMTGDWSNPTNWDYGASQTSNDEAIFILPGSYTAFITTSVVADGLTFNAPEATLDETAGSLSVGGDGLQIDSGLVSLNEANSFSNVVDLYGGVLEIGSGAALGTAGILAYGGELLGTTTETVANNISFDGPSTFAAASGTTLTLSGTSSIRSPATITIGGPGDTGTVVWSSGDVNLSPSSYTPSLDVRAGTFVFGGIDDGLSAIGSAWSSVDIETGALLNLEGLSVDFNNLTGGGTLTASNTTSLNLDDATFSGTINGYVNLVVTGNVELYGSTVVGGVSIGNGGSVASLTNNVGAVFDCDTSSSIGEFNGSTAGYFINDGTFIRNGSVGDNTVSVPFINSGTMRITTGSMTFTDGFYNSGDVEGVLTTNPGGSVTWTPDPVQEDFNGNGFSDALLMNASGALDAWNLNGSAITSGSELTYQGQPTDLGPSWSVAGIADFNGDGKADVFWRNTNGALYDWTMNGSQIESSQPITYQGAAVTLNSSWSVAGVGDFNGDGKADVLWRNTNGALYDWTMNGSQIESSQPITYQGAAVALDSSWSVAGVGDFNGDGKADVLWRNTNGALYDWTMNGSQIESSQPITYQGAAVALDSSWSVAGVGDFNGDGKADVLWRNTSGGLYDWTMNGSQIESSQPITYQGAAVAPDPSWSVAEIGNFNGNGIADILWQNTNGGMAEWNMGGPSISSTSAVTYQGQSTNLNSGGWHILAMPTDQPFG